MTSQRKSVDYLPFKKNDWIYGNETGLVLVSRTNVQGQDENPRPWSSLLATSCLPKV